MKKGAKGGKDAADALLAELQQYVRESTGETNRVDILVRAFANVGGLGAALVRDGRLTHVDQLRAFATGFSSRQAFFDFVDVGAGKERADLKVRGEPRRFHICFLVSFTFASSVPSTYLITVLSLQAVSSFSWKVSSVNILF